MLLHRILFIRPEIGIMPNFSVWILQLAVIIVLYYCYGRQTILS